MKKLAFIIIILALGIFSLRQASSVQALNFPVPFPACSSGCPANSQCVNDPVAGPVCVPNYDAACTGGNSVPWGQIGGHYKDYKSVAGYNGGGGINHTGCTDDWGRTNSPSVWTDHNGFAKSMIGAGDTFGLVIAFENAGWENWPAGGNVKLGLGDGIKPPPSYGWGWDGGTGRIPLPGNITASHNCPTGGCNNVANFYYGTINGVLGSAPAPAKAPSTPNMYQFQWRMVADGVTWIGPNERPTINFPVLVFPKPTISSIPTSMTNQPGVTVTVQAPPACSTYINLDPGTGLTNCATTGMSCADPNNQFTTNCTQTLTCTAGSIPGTSYTTTFTADNNPSCGATTNYTVNAKPTLGTQTRSPGPDAAGSGVGISGLRADDPNLTANTGTGSNIYNSIKITQPVNLANENNVKLVGVAFTSKGSPPTNSSLYEMTRSAYSDTGFVLTYAAQPASTPYKTQNWWDAMQDFTPKRYYLYRQGEWKDIGNPSLLDPYRDASIRVALDPDNRILVKPVFDVTPLQPLGSHTWGTYGYLRDSSDTQTTTF